MLKLGSHWFYSFSERHLTTVYLLLADRGPRGSKTSAIFFSPRGQPLTHSPSTGPFSCSLPQRRPVRTLFNAIRNLFTPVQIVGDQIYLYHVHVGRMGLESCLYMWPNRVAWVLQLCEPLAVSLVNPTHSTYYFIPRASICEA